MFPWLDRKGRFSWLRAATFAALAAPAAVLLGRAALGGPLGDLGADPVEELIDETGTWGIRILILALAVSPLRRLLDWPQLATLRRLVGLAAFFYLLAHFLLYASSQALDPLKIAGEIVARVYLTIGFAALLALGLLAATSTDAMIKRLGGARWRQLHRLVYLAAILAILHAWMQTRLQDYVEPLIEAGLLAWLYALRWLVPRRGVVGIGRTLLLSAGAALLTALGEALYIHLWLGAPLQAVLAANLEGDAGLRPAWVVLGATAALTAAAGARRLSREDGSRSRGRRGAGGGLPPTAAGGRRELPAGCRAGGR